MLTSIRNPKVAAAIRLKKRAFREEDRRFLVEGAQGVGESLEHPGHLLSLFVSDDMNPLAVRARRSGVDVHEVSADVMAKLTSTVTPQGIVGVSAFLDVASEALPDIGCIAVLHEVRDPGNAGTVLRSADAAGVGGVVFTKSSVDAYNPKTVRSSAGSIFHLPIVRDEDTAAVLQGSRDRGMRILAMDGHGDEDLYAVDLSVPIAFVFGNEAHGLPADVLAMADATVRVPHEGKAESLNLAAAATVCLFEWARRRRSGTVALETIVAAAAHDIRSPLTAMKGFGYALEKRWESMTEEQRTLMLRGIVYDADRMDAILRLLVDAARVAAGTLEMFPERVDLAELGRGIVGSEKRDPEPPEVRWAGEGDLVVTDPGRVKSAILAFIEAGVWWAREGPITIEGGRVRDRLELTVWRDGTELTPADVEGLFAARRPGSGAGSKIGLFVARGVAETQGGRAWAEVKDRRLSFHLDIPLSAAG
ncbi:MAG: TrmH family RNA methyltransferase [Actinomycetota bacterium]